MNPRQAGVIRHDQDYATSMSLRVRVGRYSFRVDRRAVVGALILFAVIVVVIVQQATKSNDCSGISMYGATGRTVCFAQVLRNRAPRPVNP